MPLPTFFNLPDEKRQRILECAIEEFAQHDFDSASISQIVARAGIAKGSLYQYFTDKDDLYRYLIDLASQKKSQMLAGAQPPDPGMNIFDTLRWLFREMANFELRYPGLARIGYRALYGKSPLPEGVMEKGRQSTMQYFTRLIEQGKQRGEVRAEVDAEAAAFIFTAALTELGSFLASQPGQITGRIGSEEDPATLTRVQEKYDQMIAILQHGMA